MEQIVYLQHVAGFSIIHELLPYHGLWWSSGNSIPMAGLANRKLSLFSEQRVVPHLTTADLRPELFDKVRRLMRSGDRRHPWVAFSDEELLKVGGFYNRDPNTGQPGLTMAAALLFGSDEIIQNIVPGYKFDCLLRRRNQERYDDHTYYQANAEKSRGGKTDFYPPIKRMKGEQW